MPSEHIQELLLAIGYRSLIVVLGFFLALLGYKLFRLGVFEKAGELEAAWGKQRLILKQAAPGTFFAVLGALVLASALFRPIDMSTTRAAEERTTRPGNTLDVPAYAPAEGGETQSSPFWVTEVLNGGVVWAKRTIESRRDLLNHVVPLSGKQKAKPL